jgi:hypothetical protein
VALGVHIFGMMAETIIKVKERALALAVNVRDTAEPRETSVVLALVHKKFYLSGIFKNLFLLPSLRRFLEVSDNYFQVISPFNFNPL